MATKKATKKVAKTATRKPAPKMPKIKYPVDGVFYVVLRDGVFSYQTLSLFTTREQAQAEADRLDAGSGFTLNTYVVHRVELIA